MANGNNQKPSKSSSQPNRSTSHNDDDALFSLRRSRDKFSHVGAAVAVLLAVVFGLSMVAYFGGGSLGGRQSEQNGDIAAKVNDISITRQQLADEETKMSKQMAQYSGSDDAMYQVMQGYQAFQQLKQAAIIEDAAKREGIEVKDDELLTEAKKQLGMQLEMQRMQIGQKKPMSDKEWADFIKKQTGKSVDELINSAAEEAVKNDSAQLRLGILQQRLQAKVSKAPEATDEQIKAGMDTLNLRHILVSTSKRSDADALKIANDLESKIKKGEDFAKLASQYSDDPGSKVKGGDLGTSIRSNLGSMYVSEFADAANKLKLGEVSEPVKSQFGYHIIKLDRLTTGVPKDFDKKRAQYKKSYEDQQKQAAWSKYQKDLIQNAKIEINDPEIKLFDEVFGNAKESVYTPEGLSRAVKLFEEASKTSSSTNMQLELAQLYTMQASSPSLSPTLAKQLKQKAADTFRLALRRIESVEVRLQTAQLLRELGDIKGAIEQLQMASKVANTRNMSAQDRILAEYKKLGQPKLVEAQKKIIADYKQQMAPRPMPSSMKGASPEPAPTKAEGAATKPTPKTKQ